MITESTPVISYSTPGKRVSRFRAMRCLLPFGIGTALGVVMAICIIVGRPVLGAPFPTLDLGIMAFAMSLPPAWLYIGVVVFLICCIARPPLHCASWMNAGLRGLLLPTFPLVAMVLVHLVRIVGKLPEHIEEVGVHGIMLTMIAMILVTPFLLLHGAGNRSRPKAVPVSARRISIAIGWVTIPVLTLVLVWRQTERTMLDHACAQLVTWVRSSYPVPSELAGLALPAQFDALAADHKVDVVALPDGRVVLLLKTDLSWHGNWSGLIYSSGSISSSQIGTDYYGRRRLSLHGLSDHHIKHQVDDRHFAVAFDLN